MLKIRDIMTHDVVTFSAEDSLIEAIEVLAERHISGAPVMRGERLVGVLTASDVLEFVASNPSALADFGDSHSDSGDSALAGHSVSEAMSGGPACTLAPDAPIQAAADLMRQANVHRVFIIDNDRLVGVVSSLDVTRALAERKIKNRTFVFPGT